MQIIKLNYLHLLLTGALIWLWFVFNQQPNAHHHEWAKLLLQLAVLVWVPVAFQLLGYAERTALPVALGGYGLVAAMLLPPGTLAGSLACGWLLICLWVFKKGVDYLLSETRDAGRWALGAAQLFLIIGALWAIADRFGWQPLGFDRAIVLLTGVNFHYAGFLFPLLTGWLYQQAPSRTNQLAAQLAIVAVPLTAVGITISQLTGNFIPEAFAATTVAVSGWLCGWGYFRLSSGGNIPLPVRLLWTVTGLSLFFSMTLALGYAMRPFYPMDWMQIPFMRAWHGTVNALGVGGCGVLGWRVFRK
jgi:hypothetical protein